MIRKMNYIFDCHQKVRLLILTIIIFIGSFVEMLGVSAILPLVNVVMDPTVIDNNKYFLMIKNLVGISDVKGFIVFLSMVLVFVYFIKNIYVAVMYDLQYRFTYNNQRRLASKMLDCYMNQNYLFHVENNVAELQRNVTSDVTQFFCAVLAMLNLITEVSVCLVIVIFLLFTDVFTTLCVAFIVLLFAVFFALFYRKILVKKGIASRNASIKMNRWILTAFTGIKDIKVLSRERFFLNEFDSAYCSYATEQRKQMLMGVLPRPIMETVCVCGLLLTMAIRIYNGVDLHSFIPILSVFAVAAFRMLPSFNRITNSMSSISFNKPSVDAVYNDLQYIDTLPEVKKGKDRVESITFDKSLLLNHITFQYPNTSKVILNDVSLDIQKNTSVAFIGTSGSGKSTLADVILGILLPQTGMVTIDGHDIYQNISGYHRLVGYIPQVIYLMEGTIRENVAFGIPSKDVSEEKVWKALKQAQLDEFVKELENGIDTNIGDRGLRLSGGQRQRIGIARALYHNPQILVLDEATSALDNSTENAVMNAIDSLQGEKTLIIIAHRLTTIKNVDYIYEVEDGCITKKRKEEILF